MSATGESGVGTSGRLLSACVGSVFTATLVTPLDVAKVQMQAESGSGSSSSSSRAGMDRVQPPRAVNFKCRGPSLAGRPLRPAAQLRPALPVCGYQHSFEKLDPRCRHSCRLQCSTMALNAIRKEPELPRTRPPKPPPPGTLGTLRSIAMEEGLAGLYAGLPATLALAVPSNILYFWVYEVMRDNMRASKHHAVVSSAPIVAGGASRLVAAVACAPIEVVRTRVQASRVSGTDLRSCDGQSASMVVLRRLLQKEGAFALFRGLESTLWRDVPFSAFYWAGVEVLRSEMLRRGFWQGSPWQAPLASLAAGVLAGSTAAFATTPFDVLKTRRQVEGPSSCGRGMTGSQGGGGAANSGAGPLSLWRTLARIVREEGAPALLTGATPRVARVTPACGIMLGSYEMMKVFLLPQTNQMTV
eukprot:gnl/TRDRNA2_/TRDRNA2_90309_c0_seq1.p1 gnl/TRDRNA2_/TRDRNA2_90309_c0~~gnl/TRDRNA2_/TRDRNA2_90309_c0_seq1.p1  ORF type:complete len:430 (-),score=50.79 gnl/TRDRNA2_/TRDRNA2_90309_c0_seq1:25-1269(-)